MATVTTSISISPTRISLLQTFQIAIELTSDDIITNSQFVFGLHTDLSYVSDDYNGVVVGQTITFDTGDFLKGETKTITITAKTNTVAGAKGNIWNFTSDEYSNQDTETFTVYTFAFVGMYPLDVEKIGNKFPAVLIDDSNEKTEIWQGGLTRNTYTVRLYIYNNYNGKNVSKTEIQQLLKIQNQ